MCEENYRKWFFILLNFFPMCCRTLCVVHFTGELPVFHQQVKRLLVAHCIASPPAPPRYRAGRRLNALCHLCFKCTEAFLTDWLLFLMKEICLLTALYAQLIKTTPLYYFPYILFGRQKLLALSQIHFLLMLVL